MTTVPNLTLNDGNTIPQLGFGVFQIEPARHRARRSSARSRSATGTSTPRRCTATRRASARASARPVSTARDVFVTSKLNNGFHAPDDARRAFDETLAALGMDYVDLFLIHWPLPTLYDGDYVSTWKALEEFKPTAARARSASPTSRSRTCERLAAESDVVPAVNQIELHPYLANEEVRAYGREHGIATEAWSPIAQGGCSTTR